MTYDLVEMIGLQAAEYRRLHKLAETSTIEAVVPLREATRLRAEHGSLRAAADASFNPGSVTLVCHEWRELRDKVNARIDSWPPPWRLGSLYEFTRIALAYGSGEAHRSNVSDEPNPSIGASA